MCNILLASQCYHPVTSAIGAVPVMVIEEGWRKTCFIFCFHRANWHYSATLTKVFPCFFLSCKANARVYIAKTGHGPHFSQNCELCCSIYCFASIMCCSMYFLSVLFYVLFVCKCILYY